MNFSYLVSSTVDSEMERLPLSLALACSSFSFSFPQTPLIVSLLLSVNTVDPSIEQHLEMTHSIG